MILDDSWEMGVGFRVGESWYDGGQGWGFQGFFAILAAFDWRMADTFGGCPIMAAININVAFCIKLTRPLQMDSCIRSSHAQFPFNSPIFTIFLTLFFQFFDTFLIIFATNLFRIRRMSRIFELFLWFMAINGCFSAILRLILGILEMPERWESLSSLKNVEFLSDLWPSTAVLSDWGEYSGFFDLFWGF